MRRLLLPAILPFAFFACSDDNPGGNDSGVQPPHDAGLADSGGEAQDAGLPDSGQSNASFPRLNCSMVTGACVQFESAQTSELFDKLNDLANGTTVILGTGTFDLNNAVTIRDANHVTLTGQGIDVTMLSFANQPAQANGVDVIGDDFTISYLTITDSKKDGLRIEESMNVWIDHVKVTWSGGPLTTNGSYGIYPVRCTNVLLENSEAYNAADAGLYVGQSINVIVRNNVARSNVAGLEIENTEYADVHDNVVEDNAGGLLIFDLPGNPVIGRDISVHNNTVRFNNRANFAASGTTVSAIPAGTGTFALASRRVEIKENIYESNDTGDIALLSGLVIRSSTDAWALPIADARGTLDGLDLINTGTHLLNYRTYDIWVHDNTHMGSGMHPDDSDMVARELGVLLALVYFGTVVDDVLYDGVGEMVDPMTAANNTNNNHLCIGSEGDGTFAVLDIPRLAAMVAMNDIPTTDDVYRPAAPFAPFDCNGFTPAIAPVDLPFGD